MFIHPELGRQLARSRSEEAQATLPTVAASREAALERHGDAVTPEAGTRDMALLGTRRRWLARRPSLNPGATRTTNS